MEITGFDILFRLLFAHILSDFVIQSDKVVSNKNKKKITSHIYHSLTHAILSYCILLQWDKWFILPVIFVSHLLIDLWKTNQKDRLFSFIIDQVLHLLIIISLWLILTEQFDRLANSCMYLLKNEKIWGITIAYLLILKPSSIFLSLFTKRWRMNDEIMHNLQNAGCWIGYLERVMILTFVLLNQIEAIGFLLAAKSIFRFGELNNTKDIKTTEYVLIGTFASFMIAIMVGLAVRGLL